MTHLWVCCPLFDLVENGATGFLWLILALRPLTRQAQASQ